MGTGESLDGGRRVHVGDRHRDVGDAGVVQHVPGVQHLLVAGHIGHRAAGGEVRQHDGLARRGQDVGRLGHEVHAAEDDVVGVGTRGGIPSEFEGIARHIGEGDHLIALIVVTQHEHVLTESVLGRCGPFDQPRIGRLRQGAWAVDTPLGLRIATPPEQQQRM